MDINVEEWRPIEGHDGYEVSSFGRVRSLDREIESLSRWGSMVRKKLKGRDLVLSNQDGYRVCNLGAGIQRCVHILVARAFVPGWAEGLEVNHDDGVRSNNRPSNLEWMTTGDNIRHGFANLPRKSHAKPVSVEGVLYASGKAAAEALATSTVNVSKCLLMGWKCKGKELARG